MAVVAHVGYEALPFAPWAPGRKAIVASIVRKAASMETLFTDFQPACRPLCNDITKCEQCADRMRAVANALSDPTARVWEVWKNDSDEVVGILYLTKIIPGCDALAHYVFFDGDLQGKTELLNDMIRWCFAEHEDWIPLRRITVEIPTYAFSQAKHATRKLGFGGQFKFRHNRKRGSGAWKADDVSVEGVRRSAIRWRGEDADLLVLGRLNA